MRRGAVASADCPNGSYAAGAAPLRNKSYSPIPMCALSRRPPLPIWANTPPTEHPPNTYTTHMDGYNFQATVAGIRVSFRISGATIEKWRRGIAPEGDMQPVKDTARRLARTHLRRHAAQPGETWLVRFTAKAIECRRVPAD